MATKSRDPRDISRDDLVTWSQDLCMFLTDHAGDIDLTPRAADFPPLAAAYEDAYHAAIDPKQYSPLLHDEVEKIAESLEEILRELRGRIPLIPGNDETVLAHFGLGDPVPTDWDELDAVAQVCSEYWKSLADPPEYAPIKPRMDEMSALVTLFDSKHSAYRASIGDKQDAVNLRERRRADLLVIERIIFNWYYAAHPKGDDDWWRTTPWGETPGEKIPAPKKFAYDKVAEKFSWDTVKDADEYEVQYSEHGESDDWTTLYKGAANETTNKPSAPDVYDFRVRAIKGDNEGKWSKVIVVNFPDGAKLPAPSNFAFDAKKQLFTWDAVVGADNYQVEISRDSGQTWIPKYDGADAKFNGKHLDPGKCLVRVRALNAIETSPWGITLEVWLGVPNVPGNMRWHPEEYHGDMFAKIEWDIAAGATEYQLDYINDGESFNTGANTFKYEDIIGLPREHEYKVRAGNAYGWSEFSPVFIIVLA